MIDALELIITDVLDTLYQQFWFSLVLAVLCMVLYMYAKEKGWKKVVVMWLNHFKTNKVFRRYFLLAFYTSMILLRTVLNRSVWKNPLEDVIGTWGLFYEDGTIATEGMQNLALFFPFTILWLLSLSGKKNGDKVLLKTSVKNSLLVSLVFSLGIEFAQLSLRLGTFQLSDIFYNTLGGLLGGIFYYIICKIGSKKIRKEETKENDGK